MILPSIALALIVAGCGAGLRVLNRRQRKPHQRSAWTRDLAAFPRVSNPALQLNSQAQADADEEGRHG